VDETRVSDHYRQTDLTNVICAAVKRDGVALDAITIADLALVDEFHVGGRAATVRLCELLAITADDEVLDLGCGIGGLARHVAATTGSHVTGIDLTAEYVETAADLTALVGLAELVSFRQGSVTALPFADDSFDVATQLHVGMNIADKPALFGEVARVVRPGGRFGIYDIVIASDAPESSLTFPVPWASEPATSHLARADTYVEGLRAAGFEVTAINDRTEAAREFFAAQRASPPAPRAAGLQLLMGADIGAKVSNLAAAIMGGALAPTEILAVRR